MLVKHLPGIICFALLVILLITKSANAQQPLIIKGYITEKDTVTAVPFAYVVNKKVGTGTVTSDKGYFEISAKESDTLLFSCIGFVARKICVKDILSLPSYAAKKSIILFPQTYALKQVVIQPGTLSKNEKSYYERFINTPPPALTSPISALYYQFSREGRERQKLVEIYKRELFFERAEQRLNYYLTKKKIDLTNFDKRGFIMYCGLTEEFVDFANNYDFYYKISRCFDQYTGNADYR